MIDAKPTLSRQVSLGAMEKLAQSVAQFLGRNLPNGIGFAVLVFDQDIPENSRKDFLTYVSNSDRAGMARVLREAAEIIEKSLDVPGAAQSFNA